MIFFLAFTHWRQFGYKIYLTFHFPENSVSGLLFIDYFAVSQKKFENNLEFIPLQMFFFLNMYEIYFIFII